MGKTVSKALIRVRNNTKPKTHKPTSEGIFLSINQLKKLSDALKNLNADGAIFMVGKVAGRSMRTVEIIPYHDSMTPKILDDGHLNINIGKNNSSGNDIFINNDSEPDLTFSFFGDTVAASSTPSAKFITTGSQRTPPPFA